MFRIFFLFSIARAISISITCQFYLISARLNLGYRTPDGEALIFGTTVVMKMRATRLDELR